MSSFLDSTGLSRLVSKITDYFAKKDGTYPDMTVGKASNLSPLSNCNEYIDLDFTSASYETFIANASTTGSLANKLWGSSFDSTDRCVRSLVRLHISNSIATTLGLSGVYPIIQVMITRQVGYALLLSNIDTDYIVKLKFGQYGNITSIGRFGAKRQVGSKSTPVYMNPDGSVAACGLTKRPAVTGGNHLDWLFQNTTVITFGTSVNLDSQLVPDTTIDDVVHFLIVGNTASSAITITANNIGTSIPVGKYGMFMWTLGHVWKAVSISSFV